MNLAMVASTQFGVWSGSGIGEFSAAENLLPGRLCSFAAFDHGLCSSGRLAWPNVNDAAEAHLFLASFANESCD